MIDLGLSQLRQSIGEPDPDLRSRFLEQGIMHTDAGEALSRLSLGSAVILGDRTFDRAIIGLESFLRGVYKAAWAMGENSKPSLSSDQHALHVARNRLIDAALNNYHHRKNPRYKK